MEGEHTGVAVGGDRGSCHDSKEWNESRDPADDSAGEPGSLLRGSSGCGSVLEPLTLSRVDVEGVRSLRAGAVAARRDANAATLVLLTRNCPAPSSAPPLTWNSSASSFCVALVERCDDFSKPSSSGEGLRLGSVG